MKNNFLHDLGISINLLLAGFFGALLLVRKEGKTWKDNILTLLTGSFTASYIAPFVAETFNVKSQNALTFFGFLIGFGSIKFVEYFMDKFIKKEEKNDKSN